MSHIVHSSYCPHKHSDHRRISIDTQILRQLVIATLDGGFGEKIARYYGNSEMRVLNYGLRKEFADRYNLDELMKANRLTDKQMAEDIAGILE